MKIIFRFAIMMLVLACTSAPAAWAQEFASVVVSWNDGLAAVDAPGTTRAAFERQLPGAVFADAATLPQALARPSTKLVVIPTGSAFPESAWAAIYSYLQGGGNLLTLGGRPFTRPAYFEGGTWKLRPETYAFARQLLINDYQPTLGSSALRWTPDSDAAVADLPEFEWQQAFSLVIRLSDESVSVRDGASGTLDARLKTVVWGDKDARHVAAPVIQIDHFSNNFVGGRWTMVNCVPGKNFYSGNDQRSAIAALARRSLRGAEEFSVAPSFPLYLPNEPWQLHVVWNWLQRSAEPARLEIEVENEGKTEATQTVELSPRQFPLAIDVHIATNGKPGLHKVVARLKCGKAICGVSRTGFWVRDPQFLRSGPKVTVDQDFFRIDGHVVPIVGTTYMASDVQRQYFRHPNPYVWDQDMEQISRAGLNTIRTGWWTDWSQLSGGTDTATEQTVRTLEAFLMTARKHNLPVQFNLFAFIPEVFGGQNAYLDPEALRRQQAFIRSVVEPFKGVPFLMWDLINEPSFDNPTRLWSMRPNGDAYESTSWNQWLSARYANRSILQSAWKTALADGPVPVPAERDFSVRSANEAGRPLATYDYHVFGQEKFRDWVKGIRSTIRQTGSEQLITIGQDESGGQFGPSPAFFYSAVDFTTMHSWWANDDLLWDSLVTKQRGLPTLIQETGLQHEFDADARPRRDSANEASLLERKIAIGLGAGAGTVQWLWNVNSYMRPEMEVTIGAVRPDGTEKPDAEVMRAFGKFAAAARDHLSDAKEPQVAILTSQALQYSVLGKMSLDAQSRAVRVMNYTCQTPARLVAENHVADIAGSRLVIVPSAQALSDPAWREILRYAEDGGNVLLSGPAERDEHWLRTQRLRALGLDAEARPMTYRGARIEIGGDKVELGFGEYVQEHAEALSIVEHKSFVVVSHGKGRIFVASHPLELAESPESTARVYEYVLQQVGIEPPFKGQALSRSVLVRPVEFADSMLYLIVSESSQDEDVDLKDRLTGASVHFTLPAQRAKLLLLSKKDGSVIAAYNGPEFQTPGAAVSSAKQ